MTDNAVRLTYQQYRAVRRLVHDCCNYDGGNCLLLDDGEECVCPQSISYSLICRWFRAAVLPLDESLCAALLHRRERKKWTGREKILFTNEEKGAIIIERLERRPLKCARSSIG